LQGKRLCIVVWSLYFRYKLFVICQCIFVYHFNSKLVVGCKIVIGIVMRLDIRKINMRSNRPSTDIDPAPSPSHQTAKGDGGGRRD
jgi:hypothetical protein